MLSTRVFRPTLMAGIVYGREVGSNQPMQPIGGVEELTLAIDETKIVQANYESVGGGNRAAAYRINAMTMTAKLQDLNPVNIGRSLRALFSEVAGATVVDELAKAIAGGLTPLAGINPTTVVVKNATTHAVIPAANNYEVRPEGIFWYDAAPALASAPVGGLGLEVSYAYAGYDLLQVLTRAAPTMEYMFAGVNEFGGTVSNVELFRVQMSATKGFNLISGANFSTLDVEGEVLQDPTKTGAGTSRYMRIRAQQPA